MKQHNESALIHVTGFYKYSEVKKYRPALVSYEENDTWKMRKPNNREVCELYRWTPREHFAQALPAVSCNDMGLAISMAIFAIKNFKENTKSEQ